MNTHTRWIITLTAATALFFATLFAATQLITQPTPTNTTTTSTPPTTPEPAATDTNTTTIPTTHTSTTTTQPPTTTTHTPTPTSTTPPETTITATTPDIPNTTTPTHVPATTTQPQTTTTATAPDIPTTTPDDITLISQKAYLTNLRINTQTNPPTVTFNVVLPSGCHTHEINTYPTADGYGIYALTYQPAPEEGYACTTEVREIPETITLPTGFTGTLYINDTPHTIAG